MDSNQLTWSEELTLPKLLNSTANLYPENIAINIDGEKITYVELIHKVRSTSAFLIDVGLKPGDRIGLLMQNSADLLMILFGAAYIGIQTVIINARFSPEEIAYVITNSQFKKLFVGNHGAPVVSLPNRVTEALNSLSEHQDPLEIYQLGDRSKNQIESDSIGQFLDLKKILINDKLPYIQSLSSSVSGKDIYFMLYTSGTTSNPKGCLIKHESMISNGMMVGRDHFRLQSNDIMWNVLPMFHVSSLTPLHSVLDAGATFVSSLHFDPELSIDTIKREACTILFPSYPAIMQPLIAAIQKNKVELPAVRAALTAGPPEVLLKYQQQLPSHITHISCYGSTEIGGIGTMGHLDDPLEDRIATGKPLRAFQYQVRDIETGHELPPGTTGKLWVKSLYLFTEYNRDKLATQKAFDDDGWFDTGDLAYIDSNNNIFHKGRTKDMLKVGGENVAAAEVESALLSHPSVAIAAVVGKPDEKYQEVPIAFIELQPGYSLDADGLKNHLTTKLAKYKIPREFHVVDNWPMSATKIQKFKLLDKLNEPLKEEDSRPH